MRGGWSLFGKRGDRRHFPGSPTGARGRNRVEQQLCVVVLGIRHDMLSVAKFDDLPLCHDGDVVADVIGCRQIVGDV